MSLELLREWDTWIMQDIVELVIAWLLTNTIYHQTGDIIQEIWNNLGLPSANVTSTDHQHH
jgi:hypothetical protein